MKTFDSITSHLSNAACALRRQNDVHARATVGLSTETVDIIRKTLNVTLKSQVHMIGEC